MQIHDRARAEEQLRRKSLPQAPLKPRRCDPGQHAANDPRSEQMRIAKREASSSRPDVPDDPTTIEQRCAPRPSMPQERNIGLRPRVDRRATRAAAVRDSRSGREQKGSRDRTETRDAGAEQKRTAAQDSRVVPDLSTDWPRPCFASQIERDAAFPRWYGRSCTVTGQDQPDICRSHLTHRLVRRLDAQYLEPCVAGVVSRGAKADVVLRGHSRPRP